MVREVGDRVGEANSLDNIGAVQDNWGDEAAALGFYEQALPIQREVWNRAGLAATLNNIGMVHHRWGKAPGSAPPRAGRPTWPSVPASPSCLLRH